MFDTYINEWKITRIIIQPLKLKNILSSLIERIVISQIFTRGVELQNENDLTV